MTTVSRNRLERHIHAQDSESIVKQVSHILNEIRREHGEQREQRPDPRKGSSIQQAGGKGGSGRRSLQKSLRGAGELPRWLRALAALPQDPSWVSSTDTIVCNSNYRRFDTQGMP